NAQTCKHGRKVRLHPLSVKERVRNDVVYWKCINDETVIYMSYRSVFEPLMFPTTSTFGILLLEVGFSFEHVPTFAWPFLFNQTLRKIYERRDLMHHSPGLEGKILKWCVQKDDSLCTLLEAFEKVEPKLGFNIELKLDDNLVYSSDHLSRLLLPILQVVCDYGKDRPIIFSSFHPDAALLARKLQSIYPVFFLTNGGTEMYYDVRRNSLEEAIKVCVEGGLQGIVSEVKGEPRCRQQDKRIQTLSLMTYGKLNNVAEAVNMQHLMGIEGVMVDHITEAVREMMKPSNRDAHDTKPNFSERELSFLLKLIPELIQH
ncbi:LOW QUALITY PROTEIN: hypothetical protein HID58_079605, partial [Brassica napus]